MKKITVTKKTTAKVVGGLAKYIVLIFIFAFLLFPVYWMLVTALKTNIESYRLVPTLWPETISLDGFKTLISDGKFLVYYKNNIIVSAMAAVIICFISVFAGYALVGYLCSLIAMYFYPLTRKGEIEMQEKLDKMDIKNSEDDLVL